MKANRKFKDKEDEAVSAVIGVILMVAITVAIAATVYVYVSGMMGPTKRTPSITCQADDTNNQLVVITADSGVAWSDIQIRTNRTGAEFGWNTVTENVTVELNWTTIGRANFGATGNVIAGDYFSCDYNTNASYGGIMKVSMRYIPTNTVIGNWDVNV